MATYTITYSADPITEQVNEQSCSVCNGEGSITTEETVTCSNCDGTGVESVTSFVTPSNTETVTYDVDADATFDQLQELVDALGDVTVISQGFVEE